MSDVQHFVHRPGGALRRYVREILWVSSEAPRVQVLLPETGLTLAFRQSGGAWLEGNPLPQAVISGLQQRARTVEHGAGSSMAIVRFTEVGGAAILHDRADLLYNRTVPLDDVMPRHAFEQVRDAPDASALEEFLARRIRARDGIAPQIEAAARVIRGSEGRAPIAQVARQAAMSRSALERQFRAAVGATPKSLSRLARLQHVCGLWDSGKSLTEIAYEAGYSDQPHLVRDFRLFTGTSPEKFFRGAAPRNLPHFYK